MEVKLCDLGETVMARMKIFEHDKVLEIIQLDSGRKIIIDGIVPIVALRDFLNSAYPTEGKE